jgi:hypothetical protein
MFLDNESYKLENYLKVVFIAMDLPESGVFGEVFLNRGLLNDSTFSQIDLAGQYL